MTEIREISVVVGTSSRPVVIQYYTAHLSTFQWIICYMYIKATERTGHIDIFRSLFFILLSPVIIDASCGFRDWHVLFYSTESHECHPQPQYVSCTEIAPATRTILIR